MDNGVISFPFLPAYALSGDGAVGGSFPVSSSMFHHNVLSNCILPVGLRDNVLMLPLRLFSAQTLLLVDENVLPVLYYSSEQLPF